MSARTLSGEYSRGKVPKVVANSTAGRPKRDVAPRLVSARKREHSRKRNPLWGLAIVASEGVGFGMGARENPGVTNFATPGFKW